MSTKGLRQAVESLRTISPRLNALTDRANDTVRDVEQFLNDECSIGIEACVPVSVAPDGPEGIYLEYRRVGPRFRVAVVEADGDGQDASVKPWTDCRRETKLQTFAKLPELLSQIALKADSQVKETEATALEVADTLSALRQSAKSEIDF